MKVTKTRLKEIIREEIQKLNEADNASDIKRNIINLIKEIPKDLDYSMPSTDAGSIAFEGPEGRKAYKQLGKDLQAVEKTVQKFVFTLKTKLQKISRKY
tara:strand:+ start:50 stop:346 length:297 start_codon:yes stop_codon:yes gene_type:complete